VSLTIQQRAQVRHLHQIEGLSLRMVARMTGLSHFAVRSELHQALGQDASAEEKCPSSKGHVERPLHDVHVHFREEGTS
jgi:DNA-directed RNA polymerase specialized sigma24 family protein